MKNGKNRIADYPVLNRRDLFRHLLGAGISTAGLPLAAASASSKRVAIIGAGMAGLSAADRLTRAGIENVVLEARDRIGGRIWTAAPGVDLGASWIHGAKGNPLVALATAAGIRKTAFDWNAMTRFDSGKELSPSVNAEFENLFEALETQILRRQRTAENNETLADAIRNFKDALSATDQARLDYLVNSYWTQEYAADPGALSLAWFDEGAELKGGDYLLPDGYGSILKALRNPTELRLNTPVRTVRHGAGGVTLVTDQGELSADAVIVTVPLGVLKRGLPVFDPPLAGGHSRAIQRLGMGTLNKIYLQFSDSSRFPAAPAFGRMDGARLWEEWVNLAAAGGKPALLGFNAGAVAEQSEGQSDQQLTASAMTALREICGSDLPAPVEARITRWHRDPWARGAYSSLAPGSSPKERSLFSAPVHERLLFAGEACSVKHPATVRGAYETGVAAADRLVASLS